MVKNTPLPEFPSSDNRELGYQTAMTALSAVGSLVPGAGYALQQILKKAVSSPLEARRVEWFKQLGAGLQALQDRSERLEPDQLANNKEFLDVVYEATHSAMRTHREEKREALCNAVLNTGMGLSIDEVVRASFMTYIDRFSPVHLRVLRLLANPEGSPEMMRQAKGMLMGSQDTVLRAALPEHEVSQEVLQRVIRDLSTEGLLDGTLSGMASAQSLLAKRSTKLGDLFLRFISTPFGGSQD